MNNILSDPPIPDQTLFTTGRFTTTWVRWFQAVARILQGKDPIQMATYTMLTLPPPKAGQLIYVTDASGGPTTAFSDGNDWYSSIGVILV